MDGELLANIGWREIGVVGEQAEGAGVVAGADTPDVEVGELGLAGGGELLDDLANFGNDWVIHFAVEQHATGLFEQVFCPESDEHRAQNAG